MNSILLLAAGFGFYFLIRSAKAQKIIADFKAELKKQSEENH